MVCNSRQYRSVYWQCQYLWLFLLLYFTANVSAATLDVNPNSLNCSDTLGSEVFCTIQGAIGFAVDSDTIYIAPGLYRERLHIDGAASRSLTIIGSGISHTVIDSSSRGILIKEDVTIKGLTIEKSGPPRSGMGGGIYVEGDGITVNISDVVLDSNNGGAGGGIAVISGSVFLDRVSVINNTAYIYSEYSNAELSSGGGIFVQAGATLVANRSVISGNVADIGIVPPQADQIGGGFGAGIYNLGTTTLINTTVSGNTANATDLPGGGIRNGNAGNSAVLNLYNVTIANNSATNSGGGVYNFNGSVTIRNTIIANNTDNGTAPDCGGILGNEFISLNYNIIGRSTGCDTVFVAATNDRIQATPPPLNLLPLPANSISFDDISVFLVHGIDTGSFAIDYVANGSCLDQNNNSIQTDQRGAARNGTPCDAGAYEISEDIIVSPSELVTFEDQGTSKFYVALARPPTQTVQLDISSQMLTEGTIPTPTISFSAADWNTPKPVQIDVQNDGGVDGDKIYTINISSADIGVAAKSVTVTNIDTVIAPGLVVDTASINISEGGPAAILGIRLTTPPAANSFVNVNITNDMETGIDRQETISPSTLQFTDSNWNVYQDVTVTAIDDIFVDGSYSYNLIVSVAANSTDNSYLDEMVSIPITVGDNEQPSGTAGIGFDVIGDIITTEGEQATFNVALNSVPSTEVNLNFVSTAPDEGLFANNQQNLTITFTPQNWDQPQPVTLFGVEDSYADGAQRFPIRIEILTVDIDYRSLTVDPLQVINNDNDVADIVVTPTSGLVTDESGTTTSFQIWLATPPDPTTVVTLAANVQTPGSGLPLEGAVTLPPTQLVFNANNYNQPQTVVVTGLDDCLADGNKTYAITVSYNAAGTTSGPYANLNLQKSVSVTNTDNESATGPQIIASKNQLQTSETQTADSFEVCITSQPSAPVTITMTIPAGSQDEGLFDNGSNSQEIVFDQNNWLGAQTVTIIGQNDVIDDGDQTYQITIDVVSLDTSYRDTVPPTISITNFDDDETSPSGPQLIVSKTALRTSESGGSDLFSLHLASEPTTAVTVEITIGDQTEGRIAGNSANNTFTRTVTFDSLNWSNPQFITIVGRDDAEIDGNIPYTVSLAMLNTTADPMLVQVINDDNDAPPALITSKSQLRTSETRKEDSFTLALAAQPSSNVAIEITIADETEGRISGTASSDQFTKLVTFDSFNWSRPQPITIVGLDDSEDDGAILYQILLRVSDDSAAEYRTISLPLIQVTNEDNDVVDPIDSTGGGHLNPGLLWLLIGMILLRYHVRILRPAFE